MGQVDISLRDLVSGGSMEREETLKNGQGEQLSVSHADSESCATVLDVHRSDVCSPMRVSSTYLTACYSNLLIKF